MRRKLKFYLTCCLVAFGLNSRSQGVNQESLQEHWFELHSQHFNIYSCAGGMEAHSLATRLEQYRDAYAMLTSAQSVSSPPIIVLAFPDHKRLEPFLPLYNGQPANLSGFFKRGNDENLIVMSFTGTNASSMDVIFHEYSHLLFRRNQNIWPVWLSEGMAEMYSTFDANGRGVQIGKPIARHLRTLSQNGMIPLSQLMNVDHGSPDYNERDRQGVFYAESWLLTHFLMSDANPALKARFGRFTKLLEDGENTQQAFTNALGMPLAAIEKQLQHYLEQGNFQPVNYLVPASLNGQRVFTSRVLGQPEIAYRLGNELMRINRDDDAANYFKYSLKLAPNSPMGYEGLGMLAAGRQDHPEAVRLLKHAVDRNSGSFLTHAIYAHQKLLMQSDADGNFSRLDNATADELKEELIKSMVLMPDYGMAHQLLGVIELSRGQNLDEAQKHLERAIELQPENQTCRLELAEVKWRRRDSAGARVILTDLAAHALDSDLRKHATDLLTGLK